MGVKSYTESKSLLQYEGKVELGEEQESSFGSGAKKKQLPPIESNPGIKETLYSMFLPREWEENGKKCGGYEVTLVNNTGSAVNIVTN